MGDRGNIHLVNDNIYLYTHWNGSELLEILRQALIRGKSRWNDRAYLNRIIFSEMIKDDILSETGYGLSNFICDNNHRIIEVDVDKMKVDRTSFEKFIEKPKGSLK